MSGVIGKAVGLSVAQMEKLKAGSKAMSEGFAMIGAGKKGFQFLEPAVEAFGEIQAAANETKASMMTNGGVLDDSLYQKVYEMSEALSDKYKGSTASYLDMVMVMKNNRLTEADILGGIGESAAKLADLFQIPAASVAEFASRTKNDLGVSVKEMPQMMDLVARVQGAGVGKTGQEGVQEMGEFFSKVGLGMQNLHMHGVEAAKQMGVLGAMFMGKNLSGQTVGTNFRRILDNISDPKKLAKVNAAAAQYGKSMSFFDRSGHFIGIDNMVQQLGKLSDLNPEAITKILDPFSGKQGLSNEFIKALAGKEGIANYADVNRRVSEQASMSEKLKQIMTGMNYQTGVMSSSWMNLKAAFGAGLAPAITRIVMLLNECISSVRVFLENNPRVAKFAGAFIALASAGMMIVGVIRVIQGITMVMRVLNLTMISNPFILIATIAITAAALIYSNWDRIGPFFKRLWDNIKKFFSAAWEFIKMIFYYTTPEGLIIKNWSKIVSFFSDLWDKVKGIFMGVLRWYFGLYVSMYNAGKNIVLSIWNGMKAVFNKPIELIKSLVKKIRNFLPFSPAKEGALRDIHRIKLVETIAASIKPDSLVKAMSNVTAAAYNTLTHPRKIGGGSAGACTQLVFSPEIHLHGGATDSQAQQLIKTMKDQFVRWMKDYDAQRQRVSYSI